jgi:hypothetical protein
VTDLLKRLRELRLNAEAANDLIALKRVVCGLIDLAIAEVAAVDQEQGSRDSRVVPCYQCGSIAIRCDGAPLCAACKPPVPEAPTRGEMTPTTSWTVGPTNFLSLWTMAEGNEVDHR